ncbi:hypothetical protein J1G42_05305 [Cellulomonas sp. zg-ZUI222]|uniref:Uncharacterized protein n=1 Tax=Cellulomonas wangleii TaxID=2816956 RepID=A0ABX8D5F1_9CELL|nr:MULTISPECIES: hypothetical protein [Cellulomonas]MBO0899389.1 hypothetical protein [Cellulomonas sp. zg-ZUI22]MBO0920241.1 hypothetical protein [Cellulomonas wangleii]MBO0923334.1 hypothetical protein [Cellulomonas wangleii]QVI61691.1 hypothetical protein KG103_14700 [Cellulomonas wangleii]
MSTVVALTVGDVRRDGERALAIALGLVRRTIPPLHLPALEQRMVAGGSPLEASGWAGAGTPAARRR